MRDWMLTFTHIVLGLLALATGVTVLSMWHKELSVPPELSIFWFTISTMFFGGKYIIPYISNRMAIKPEQKQEYMDERPRD